MRVNWSKDIDQTLAAAKDHVPTSLTEVLKEEPVYANAQCPPSGKLGPPVNNAAAIHTITAQPAGSKLRGAPHHEELCSWR